MRMTQETWKPIIGYETVYEISCHGNVKRVSSQRILKYSINNRGYALVHLFNGNISKTCSVHRLVAEHFIPNPHNKPDINHIDNNKINNDKSNLEWTTAKDNNALYKALRRKKLREKIRLSDIFSPSEIKEKLEARLLIKRLIQRI